MRKSFLVFALAVLFLSIIPGVARASSLDLAGNGGLAGYLSSKAWIDDAILEMSEHNATILRLSFVTSWSSYDLHRFDAKLVEYYLNLAPENWRVVVDRNHLYPYGDEQDQQFIAHLSTAKSDLREIGEAWPNDPRVIVELANEFTGDISVIQSLLDDFRSAGYSNPIVYNKLFGSWEANELKDPLGKTYRGTHLYFNTWSLQGAIEEMKTALTFGAVLNTEIGADFNEAKAFTKTTIGEMNAFLAWSRENNVLNCIWLNDKLSNLASYEQGAEIIDPKQADGVSSYSFGGVSLSGLMGIFVVIGFVLKIVKENS